MVDSNDSGRLEEARESLFYILNDESMRDVPVLVYANKMDLPNALTVPQLSERLGLMTLRDRKW